MLGPNWREDNRESSENVNWALKEESTWGIWKGGVMLEAVSSKGKKHVSGGRGMGKQSRFMVSQAAGQDESTSSKKRLV